MADDDLTDPANPVNTAKPVDPVDPARADVIERWAAIDDEYGQEILDLAKRDRPAAAALFDQRLQFGTAGLRGAMGPGPGQMNRLVVRQTTAGLMDWLAAGAVVAVGYDARHHSRSFAHDAVAVVAARGGRALLIDQPAPTPVLARAVLDHQADAGVMITASHNPAQDNGYKLYLGDGIQLVSPADAEIAAAIDRVADLDPLDRDPLHGRPLGHEEAVEDITEVALARHREQAIAALATDHRDISILYTAMHGVAGRHLLDCFARAGFVRPQTVPAQFDPDPDFPTVPFPNPEEAGALDLAFAAASAEGVDLVLANDPDGDRLAVGVPGPDGRWVRLTGDEVGVLLADHVIRHSPGDQPGLVASSIVSSRFINRLAEANSVASVRTLTGFKWVARPIVDRVEYRYLLGYEEALGYCVGDRVRDKDGISAALVMAELAAEAKRERTSLRQRLDDLAVAHGLHVTRPVTIRLDELDDDERRRVTERAVNLGPAQLGGIDVTDREDLSQGESLPPTSGVVLDLADGSRVIVRPSGTEPKVKAYLEVVEEAVAVGEVDRRRQDANDRLGALASAVEAEIRGR